MFLDSVHFFCTFSDGKHELCGTLEFVLAVVPIVEATLFKNTRVFFNSFFTFINTIYYLYINTILLNVALNFAVISILYVDAEMKIPINDINNINMMLLIHQW